MATDSYIVGAAYGEDSTGRRATLQGLRSRSLVILWEDSGSYEDIHRDRFKRGFSDLDEHDHESYCCTEHDVHSSPHRGCLLR